MPERKRELELDSSQLKSIKVDSSSKPSTSSDTPQDLIDMGEFEDAFEDEMDDDEQDTEIVITHDSDDDEEVAILDDQDDDEAEADVPMKIYLPGQTLNEQEELVPDQSAYHCLHTLNVEWPCLTFDILHDTLGDSRTAFPHTTYLVAGSQADKPKDNKIYVMKMSQLHKTKFDNADEMDQDSDSDDDDLDDNPILENRNIPHLGAINRIRAMPHPEHHIVSTWAETGKVHIWDLSLVVKSLDQPGTTYSKDMKPIYTNQLHGKVQGYGMDWSSTVTGRLLTGDCSNRIFLTQATQSTFTTQSQSFKGHSSSIEDIQWSPSEQDVFVTASSDKTLKVWDVRAGTKPQLSIVAHTCDINVISWNRSVDHLIASGADDGVFSIWDLRTWLSGDGTPITQPDPAATFKWHKKPITSIEWHPQESSMIAVSGADDQITLWDLALEADMEEQTVHAGLNDETIEIPPQLLFIHQGQEHIKEIHFHRQIPGLIVSTALNGFHLFKTINS